MYDSLGWMTVNQLIEYHTALTVYRVRLSSEPEYLADLLQQDSRNGRIIVPNCKLSPAQKSICYRGADAWNELPTNIRNARKIGVFKAGVKRWVLENIPRFLP